MEYIVTLTVIVNGGVPFFGVNCMSVHCGHDQSIIRLYSPITLILRDLHTPDLPSRIAT